MSRKGRRREWAPDILRSFIAASPPRPQRCIAQLREWLGTERKPAPYAPVAQAVRRLRLAGLVRRADGRKGPGLAATYALTAKGRKAAEKARRIS